MTAKLKITLGGEEYLADLLWDQAPRTCEAFVASCPFESRVFSARVCDAEVTYPVPGDIADLDLMENPKFEEPAGAIVWYGAWSCICIFFDECEPYGTCNMFARICEPDRERFARACRAVWDVPDAVVFNEIVDVEEEGE